VVVEPVGEEPKPTVKAEPDQELLLTDEITYGSRLAWIAKKYYGDKAYWPYLYDANRDRIANPSAIPVGTQIRVPKLSAAQRDTTSAAFQALKEEAYSAAR
jgi:phage tail protein X